MIEIRLNGEVKELPNGLTLDELVQKLELVPRRIAVEVNREIITRSEWPRRQLQDQDLVEIVHFVGGGS